MKAALSELVHFIGEDRLLLERVKEAVHWLASKPEGLAVLEEAKALHGKPLTFVVDTTRLETGFQVDIMKNPLVLANPNVTDSMRVVTQAGETMPFSLKRFVTHEAKHATQPEVMKAAEKFGERQVQITKKYMPVLPMSQYKHRLKAANGDREKVARVLGEMYDAHIAPHYDATRKKVITKMSKDRKAKSFIDRFEKPAIEFENFIMEKYEQEAARALDYLHSGQHDPEILAAAERQAFIKSGLGKYAPNKMTPLPATDELLPRTRSHNRIGGRTPSEIRPDASGKPQGPTELQ